MPEERARQLQLLTQRLAATLSREEIGNVVIGQAHEYLGANASIAYFLEPDGTFRLAAWRGVSQSTLAAHATLPFDPPLPLSTAIRDRRPVWICDRARFTAAYPHLAGASLPDGHTIEAIAAVPLLFGERVLGGIAFSFDHTIELDETTRDLVDTFALQCAQAVERARLYDEERQARLRLEILSETSERLSRARLDLGVLLDTLCQEVASRVLDSCTINLLSADGQILELAALHHVDPEVAEGIRATMAATPVRMGEGSVGRVAASGEPLLVPQVPFEQLVENARPEYRAHLRKHPFGSLLVVPLRTAERVIGTLTASRDRARPPFTLADQQLLQDIADRAATAIENARLFDAEQRARRLRDDFLSIAGHELRTPLAALQLQVESVQSLAVAGTFASRPELLVERLGKAVRHIGRLDTLVSQLLDVSQLTRGHLELRPEPVDARVLLAEIVERFTEHARRAHCTMLLDGDESVVGQWDRGRLDQVLTNVIGNALKYGAGKPIHVDVRGDSEACCISVRDEGLGIDPAAQERIFGRFERAISDRNYGGLGLGLWISREIVDALGGEIRCESAPGSGTTFVIRLPLGRAGE